MNRRPRWCHRVIVVVMYYHCMSVCRSIDVFFIFHHRRCGSSHVPLHSSSFAVFSSQTHLFLFFSFYIIDVLDQQVGISFSRLSREDTRLDLLLYFIIIFLLLFLLSILLLGLLLLIILLLSLSCTTRRECAQKEKRKKERRKAISKRALPAMETFRSSFSYHVILHRVYCPLRRGLERKKMEKIEEKMSPLSLPSRLKDDSMCDKSSL